MGESEEGKQLQDFKLESLWNKFYKNSREVGSVTGRESRKNDVMPKGQQIQVAVLVLNRWAVLAGDPESGVSSPGVERAQPSGDSMEKD